VETRESKEARWFTDEVQSHESALRSYLRGSFPSVRDVDDVVQESFFRVWRSRATQPIRSAKAFLFKVARHLMLDQVRRDRTSPINAAVRDLAALPVIEDRPDVPEIASMNEKVQLLAEAVALLPSRCREVVVLRKLKELSQKEVAFRLGISEKTVEVQVARGVRRCEDYLRRRGLSSIYDHETR
jgi:RNA polymerase sigma factor (sigma-70 family)